MTDLTEIFCANGNVEEGGDPNNLADGLIWKTILTPGRLELTPGPGGTKQKKPLVIVEGSSTDTEVGLTDLLDNFDGGVFENVTVPTSHKNSVLENTGYVKEMRMVEEDGRQVLQGGFKFTDPEVYEKVKNGSISNVSCGILRGYEKPRNGKKYSAVIEHVALTNKPWVDGMTPFYKLSDGDIPDGYYFADDIDLAVYGDYNKGDMFDYSSKGVEDITDAGAATKVRWNDSDSMVIRQHKLEDALDAEFASFQLLDFSPGRALIEDEEGNRFIAGYRTKEDGSIEFHPQKEWQKTDTTDLSDNTPEGGDNTVELAEVTAENEALKARLEAAEAALAASAQIERTNSAKAYVTSLSEEMGLSEAPGFLAAVEKILLADDGDTALNLSDDEGNTVEVTASDIVKSLVEALPKKDGKILLSQQQKLIEGDTPPSSNSDEELPLEDRVEAMTKWLGIDNPKIVLS